MHELGSEVHCDLPNNVALKANSAKLARKQGEGPVRLQPHLLILLPRSGEQRLPQVSHLTN